MENPVKSFTQPSDYSAKTGPWSLFGLYFRGNGFSTWASFWSLGGGGITADHCIGEMKGWTPSHPQGAFDEPFRAAKPVKCDPRVIPDKEFKHRDSLYLDAAVSGATLDKDSLVKPVRGMRVKVYGWPAAADSVSIRRGFLYMERIGFNQDIGLYQVSWIIVFDDDMKPVSGGMSGGLVTFDADYKEGNPKWRDWGPNEQPVGITITLNSATNLDDDPHAEDGMDMTALYHVYAGENGIKLVPGSFPSTDLVMDETTPSVMADSRTSTMAPIEDDPDSETVSVTDVDLGLKLLALLKAGKLNVVTT